MSLNSAIRYREEMISNYKKMLATENSDFRIEEIHKQIALCEQEILELKSQQGRLFSHKVPLKQATIIIEPDRDNLGSSKITHIPPLNPAVTLTGTAPTAKSSSKGRLGNTLRDKLKSKKAASAEASLKAKIAAAKAAKK